jgi:hypothetical protein
MKHMYTLHIIGARHAARLISGISKNCHGRPPLTTRPLDGVRQSELKLEQKDGASYENVAGNTLSFGIKMAGQKRWMLKQLLLGSSLCTPSSFRQFCMLVL